MTAEPGQRHELQSGTANIGVAEPAGGLLARVAATHGAVRRPAAAAADPGPARRPVLHNGFVRVDVLGPLRVAVEGAPVPVGGARLAALLARLAVAAPHPVSAPALIEAVWQDSPPAGAENALQSLVSRLRRTLGDPEVARAVPGGYVLALAPHDVDVTRFERLTSEGGDALRRGEPARARTTLGQALQLWRAPEPAAAVGAGECARLVELRLTVLAERIEADLALGRGAEVIGELEALVREHPQREGFTAQLMTALASAGRTSEALETYERLRRRLADDLGVDPSPRLQGRHVALLRGELSAEPAAAPAALQRNTLPKPLSSFVGRGEPIARLHEALAAGRLVTVLGTGGAGKTRMATEAATEAGDAARDGAWFVPLAPVTDPAEVPHAVLAALGQRDATLLDSRQRRRAREATETLLETLHGRRALLVLDNCEHLLDAAAELAETLLGRCGELSVLATSREALGVTGEALVPLRPLVLPDAGAGASEAAASPAVQLLVDRARAARPDFALSPANVANVVEIVRRLDGLPLAIELAAARLRSLPIGEVARRLDDRFRLLSGGSRTALARHRTLHAVVEWSWELLSVPERCLAERVAVFPAGVTPTAAAAVCPTLPGSDVPDLLSALADKSLLVLAGDAEPRYRMLETIREFGTARLAERGQLGAARDAHAECFAKLAADCEQLLHGPGQLAALSTLSAEHDNLLAALRALIDAGDAAGSVTMALHLAPYWMLHGTRAEAATWLGLALAVPGEVERGKRLTAEALRSATGLAGVETSGEAGTGDPWSGLAALADEVLAVDTDAHPQLAVLAPVLLFFLGDTKRVTQAFETALNHPEAWVRASGLLFRARFAENLGELAQVRADTEAALAEFEAIGDRWGYAQGLSLAAHVRTYDADLRGAVEATRQAVEIHAEFASQERDESAFAQFRLADLHARLGERDAAQQSLEAARELAESMGGPEMLALVTSMAGSLWRVWGDLDAAAELQRRAEGHLATATRSPFGAAHGVALLAASGALLDLARQNPAAATERLATGITAARKSRDAPMGALVGVSLAALADARGEGKRAACLLGAAGRLRGADDPTQLDIAWLTRRARAALGEQAYRAAWDAGWALERAEALDELEAYAAHVRRL
jgi:predicted ATPase/DNA-binding SARP family transcriptional activator